MGFHLALVLGFLMGFHLALLTFIFSEQVTHIAFRAADLVPKAETKYQ